MIYRRRPDNRDNGKPSIFRPADEPKERLAPRLDKIEQWRYDALLGAGYTESQALMLALRKEIDLHQAVGLARSAGPMLAFAIVN